MEKPQDFLEKFNFSLILNCGCYCNIFLTDVVSERCSRKYALHGILKGQQQLLKIEATSIEITCQGVHFQ